MMKEKWINLIKENSIVDRDGTIYRLKKGIGLTVYLSFGAIIQQHQRDITININEKTFLIITAPFRSPDRTPVVNYIPWERIEAMSFLIKQI